MVRRDETAARRDAHGPDGKPVPTSRPIPKRYRQLDEPTSSASHRRSYTDPEFVGGAMKEVVKSTSRLTGEDRRAIAVYLRSIPAKPQPEKR